jgi:two-component system, OmpR family, sensor kinase
VNVSLRRRLFVWLSTSILVAAVLAAALSFALLFDEAKDLQDDQLEQVAAVLSNQALMPASTPLRPRTHEAVEAQLVVGLLGSPPAASGPDLDLQLPATLPAGLQTLDQAGVQWRAMVSEDARGRPFAVAQRVEVRDEVAREAALLTLLPLVVLVPVLLLIVRVVLRQAFAPMVKLSAEVDRLDARELAALDEDQVPLEALPLLQAVNRLMRRLGLLLEQQRRLVSGAAHELRTPVATLIVQAENVQHVPLPAQANERMATLRQGLARMSALIDQLLSLARVQGGSPSAPQAMELDALVRTAIEESLPMAQAKDIDLGCLRIDRVLQHGDPLHAYALIRNGIDNAVRYTPRGGSVDISLSEENGQACFVVEDNGPGLDEADVERVFEPFVRVLGSPEPGSGLGLTIARTAAQALGGHLTLAARCGGRPGLRFEYRGAKVPGAQPA